MERAWRLATAGMARWNAGPKAPLAAVLATAALTASCAQPAQLHVDNAYVRLAAVPGRPAAAYFTVHGGQTPARLISVSSSVAIRTEMHQTQAGPNGAMSMARIDELAVPAKAALPFGAGGRHVMLFDVNPGIKRGSAVPLVFSFGNGLRLQVNAPAIAAGDPAPEQS